MKIEAKIKIIGEEKTGTSQTTGDQWRSRMLLLEWEDLEGTQRVWATLFNEVLAEFEKEGIKQGSLCQVDFVFTARTYRSMYNKTDVDVKHIQKVSDSEAGKGVAL